MRTTTDIYSHVMPALAREAADRMGETLWNQTEPLATTLAPSSELIKKEEGKTPGQTGGDAGPLLEPDRTPKMPQADPATDRWRWRTASAHAAPPHPQDGADRGAGAGRSYECPASPPRPISS
jgi:hypothetical protein